MPASLRYALAYGECVSVCVASQGGCSECKCLVSLSVDQRSQLSRFPCLSQLGNPRIHAAVQNVSHNNLFDHSSRNPLSQHRLIVVCVYLLFVEKTTCEEHCEVDVMVYVFLRTKKV